MRPNFGIKLDVLAVKLNGAIVQCYSNGSPFFGKHFETKEKAIEFANDFAKRNQAKLEYADEPKTF